MLSKYLLLSAGVLAFLSLTKAGTSTESIIGVLGSSNTDPPGILFNRNGSDFNVLKNLVLAANLDGYLDEDVANGFTLFAPNDNAFAQTAIDLGINGTSEREVFDNLFLFLSRQYWNPVSALQKVLAYHVVPGKMKFPKSPSTTEVEISTFDAALNLRGITRNGSTLIDLNPFQPDPRVASDKRDLEASSGIVHVIDRMLFFEPPELKESPELIAEDGFAPSFEDSSPEASLGPEGFQASGNESAFNFPDDDRLLTESRTLTPTNTATLKKDVYYFEISRMRTSPETFHSPEITAEESLAPWEAHGSRTFGETVPIASQAAFSELFPAPKLTAALTAEETPVTATEEEEASSLESVVPVVSIEESRDLPNTPETTSEVGDARVTQEILLLPLYTAKSVPTDDALATDMEGYYPLKTNDLLADELALETSTTNITPQPLYVPNATPEQTATATLYGNEPLPSEEALPITTEELKLEPIYDPQGTQESLWNIETPVPSVEALLIASEEHDPDLFYVPQATQELAWDFGTPLPSEGTWPTGTEELEIESLFVPEGTQESLWDIGTPVPSVEVLSIATEELDPDSFYNPQGTQESTWNLERPTPWYGTIEGGSCFPASQVVHLSNGSDLRISQLNAGHTIRASESHSSMVYLFTHKMHTGVFDFVRIVSDADHVITLTKEHYLYANGILKAADRVNVGDILRTLDGLAQVKSISKVRDYGLFAPHTLHGDVVVNRVVTSSYTRAVHPVIAHVLLWPLRALVHIGVTKEPLGATLYGGAAGLIRRRPPARIGNC